MIEYYNFFLQRNLKKQNRARHHRLFLLAGLALSSTVGALVLSSNESTKALDATKTEGKVEITLTPEKRKIAAEPQTVKTGKSTKDRLTSPIANAIPKHEYWQTHLIKKGDSLANIFKEKSLSPNTLHRIINSSKTAKQLAHIRPGQTLRFRQDKAGKLQELVLQKNPLERLRISANDKGSFYADVIYKKVEKRIATASGVIQSSLFIDGQKAGLSDNKIMELANLFGWDIDFALEIRAGDHFRVLYEEHYLDGKKLRDGPILAAEFVNRGKAYQAFRFADKNGEVSYHNAQGHSKRRAFIRTPIKFARVSSRFNKRRWHPVLQRWRSHNGVDYAAPTGTPIKATGAGKVIFRGRKNGYGRVVIVRHSDKYQTLYAHMSKFSSKVKKGQRVKQDQIIGYVGQSGLATGPHLHYEFRVQGVHRNPLTVKLPKSLRLGKTRLARFKKQAAPLFNQLAAIKPATLVAQNNAQ